jgi:hypothetical protein
MEPVKIREFKGLVTNIDTKDANPEYLKEAKNVVFYPGMLKTQYCNLASAVQLPSGLDGLILWYGKIFLDDDKFGNRYNGQEILSVYSEGSQMYQLLVEKIIEAEDYYEYRFHFHNGQSWTILPDKYNLFRDYTKGSQDAIVLNTDGVVKIFLPHESLWLGKISRQYWNNLTGVNEIVIDRLVEPYAEENKRATVEYQAEFLTKGIIEVYNCKFIYVRDCPDRFNRLDARPAFYRLVDADGKIINNAGLGVFLDNFEDDKIKYTKTSLEYYEDTTLWILKVTQDVVGIVGCQVEFQSIRYLSHFGLGSHDDNGWDTMRKEDFDVPFSFESPGGLTIPIAGITRNHEFIEIVITALFDTTEFVLSYAKIPVKFKRGENSDKYAVRFHSISITSSPRITGIGFYVRKGNEIDFEQFKFFNLVSKREIYLKQFFLNARSPNGFYLTQQIGILFEPSKHKVLTGFSDYREVSGVAYALKNNKIYYPTVGNGMVSNDVFYPTFWIPGFYAERILKLTDVGKFLGVHTTRGLEPVITSDSRTGTFLFSIKDAMGFVAERKEAITEAFDAVIMLTKRGIFVTNGNQDISVSQEIDDVIERTYQNGFIHVDEINKILYYFISNEDTGYYYDYQQKKWSQITFPQGIIRKVFEGLNNEKYLLIDNKLYKLIFNKKGTASIKTHLINLQESNLLKCLERITIDFQGIIKVNGRTETAETREVKSFWIRLDRRIPSETFEVAAELYDDTTIYGIEFEYDIIGERKGDIEEPIQTL